MWKCEIPWPNVIKLRIYDENVIKLGRKNPERWKSTKAGQQKANEFKIIHNDAEPALKNPQSVEIYKSSVKMLRSQSSHTNSVWGDGKQYQWGS